MVQALTTQTSDEALAQRIHIWMKTENDIDIAPAGDVVEYRPKLSIAIANEKPRRPVERGVAKLLSRPRLRGMVRDGLVDNFSRVVLDNDEGEDLAEAKVVTLHEIASPDLMCVVLEKCRPRLTARRSAFPSHSHVLLNRPLGDDDTEFEQFTANALGTPGAIILSHIHDQVDVFAVECRPRVAFGPRFLPPDKSEHLAVPTQDGVRLEEEERALPSLACPGPQRNRELLGLREPRTTEMSLGSDELLAQQGVFSDELRLRLTNISDGVGRYTDRTGQLSHVVK